MNTDKDRTQQLRDGVRGAYSAAAERPRDEDPFPVGRQFAESLGYPQDLLTGLPSTSVDAFSGVSNVAIFADIPAGATVLDLERVGPRGRVIGVDFSDVMVARARQSAAEAGVDNVEFEQGDAE